MAQGIEHLQCFWVLLLIDGFGLPAFPLRRALHISVTRSCLFCRYSKRVRAHPPAAARQPLCASVRKLSSWTLCPYERRPGEPWMKWEPACNTFLCLVTSLGKKKRKKKELCCFIFAVEYLNSVIFSLDINAGG